MPRIAILQMTSGIDPEDNATAIEDAIVSAADNGAAMIFTPEMSGLLDRDRKRAAKSIVLESDTPALARAQDAAHRAGIWVSLGSLAVKSPNDRWANRAFVIDPNGNIAGRYDKIHMFDVDLDSGESWRESNAYEPGQEVVTVPGTPVGRLGLSVCYDIRFPALYEQLGRAQCDCIAIPAAFTIPTGRAHWNVLQRARAIEASAFVVAAAQVGEHADGRRTYGHSMVVDPWGDVLLEMESDDAALAYCDLDLARIAEVRAQVPSLANRREIAK